MQFVFSCYSVELRNNNINRRTREIRIQRSVEGAAYFPHLARQTGLNQQFHRGNHTPKPLICRPKIEQHYIKRNRANKPKTAEWTGRTGMKRGSEWRDGGRKNSMILGVIHHPSVQFPNVVAIKIHSVGHARPRNKHSTAGHLLDRDFPISQHRESAFAFVLDPAAFGSPPKPKLACKSDA